MSIYLGLDVIGGGSNIEWKVVKTKLGVTKTTVWVGDHNKINIYEHAGLLAGDTGATVCNWSKPTKIGKDSLGKFPESWFDNLDGYHCSIHFETSLTGSAANAGVRVEFTHGRDPKNKVVVWQPMLMEGYIQAGFTAYGLLNKKSFGDLIGGEPEGHQALAERAKVFRTNAI